NGVLVYLLAEAVSEDVAESVKGDVNADGKFNIADLVMLRNFLLRNGKLTDWSAGDLSKDGQIDVFDEIALRQDLMNSEALY
ncbi:MAG: dockerin type I repeat-containing protein, partial [Ruminococcus sp.]|nr:dockerin type I repeat-containing protein [Ruminococcus sp.]